MTDEEQILIGLRGKRIDIAECLFRHGPQNVTKLAEICDMEEHIIFKPCAKRAF